MRIKYKDIALIAALMFSTSNIAFSATNNLDVGALPLSIMAVDRFNNDRVMGKIIEDYSYAVELRKSKIIDEINKINKIEYDRIASIEKRSNLMRESDYEKRMPYLYDEYENSLIKIGDNINKAIISGLNGELDYFMNSVKRSMSGVKIPKEQSSMIYEFIGSVNRDFKLLKFGLEGSSLNSTISSFSSFKSSNMNLEKEYTKNKIPEYSKIIEPLISSIIDEYFVSIDNYLSRNLKYSYREMPKQL